MHKALKMLTSLTFILLGLYPIIPYHYSSSLLIAFLLLSIIHGYKSGINRLSRKAFIGLIIHTGYYLVLIFSLVYSEDISKGVSRIAQLSPLFFVPFVIIFFTPKLNGADFKRFSFLFVISNLVYTFFLFNYLLNGIELGYDSSISELSLFQQFSTLLEVTFNKALWFADHNLSSSLFFHKAYFSMNYLMAIAIMFKFCMEVKKNEIVYWFNLLSCLIFLLVIFYSFSFPNVLALTLIVLVIPFFFPIQAKWKKAIYYSSYFLVLAAFLFFVTKAQYKNNDIARGINFIKSAITQEPLENNDPRFEIYKTTFNIIRESPLTGVGVGDAEQVLVYNYINNIKKSSNGKNHNYIRFSEVFDDPYWHKNNIIIKRNVTLSPIHTKTADRIISQKSNLSHNISQVIDLGDKLSICTFSVFVKPLNSKFLILRLGDISHQRISFDLEKNIVGYQGSKILSYNIKKLTNGWYRYSMSTACTGETIALIGLANQKDSYNYFSEGEAIDLWGAMVEKGNRATEYNESSNPLLLYAIEDGLNTHNNYFYFILSAGIVCLLLFLIHLFQLFKISIQKKAFLLVSFCIIIIINLLTENIFSRHFGLMFYSVFLILLFNNLLSKTYKSEPG